MRLKLLCFGLLCFGLCSCGKQGQQMSLEEINRMISEKEYPQVISALSKMDRTKEEEELLENLRYWISGDYISTLSDGGYAALDQEGNIVICTDAESYEQKNYEKVRVWSNVKRLSDGFFGLDVQCEDGKCYTTVSDETALPRNEKLSEIKDCKLLDTGSSSVAFVDSKGKLHAMSQYSDYLEMEKVKDEISGWKPVVDVITGRERVVALCEDGTVHFVYSHKLPGEIGKGSHTNCYDDLNDWSDIVAIAGTETSFCVAGLKADGTVVVSNGRNGIARNQNGMVENYNSVKNWTNIISISMSDQNILGLKKDGTVVTAGNVNAKQETVSEWKDIVAISAGVNFHLGLKEDGRIVVAGETGAWSESLENSEHRNLYVPGAR